MHSTNLYTDILYQGLKIYIYLEPDDIIDEIGQ